MSKKIQKVYIGPSIPRTQLRNAQILRGTEEEIDSFVQPLMERYPEIRKLLVEPNALSEARREVCTRGRLLHKYYQDVQAKAIVSRGR